MIVALGPSLLAALAADPRLLGEFTLVGDDYGGATVVCRRCTEPNKPYKNTRQKRLGYVEFGTVADVVKICLDHKHDQPAPAAAEPVEDEEPCCDDADELSSHYHCPTCGKRVSMMGHNCPEAKQ